MNTNGVRTGAIARGLLALALIGGLIFLFAALMMPGAGVLTILMYAAMGAAVVVTTLIAMTLVSLTFRQFILRMGGTDAQWFWFSSEPRGLEQQRQQLREDARSKADS